MTNDVFAKAKDLQDKMERYSRAIHYMKTEVKPLAARMNLMTEEIFNREGVDEPVLFKAIIDAIQDQYERCQVQFSSL